MAGKIAEYFREGIWRQETDGLHPLKASAVEALKAVIIAVKGFRADKCEFRASALTFYTLLSIVPVAAMLFAVARGFGMEKHLRQRLYDEFSQHSQTLDYVVSFANSLLENTRAGAMAGVGVIILIYTIIKVLGNIEESFNDIWKIDRPRPLTRMISDYLSFVLICPVLLVLSGSITVFIATFLKGLSVKIGMGHSPLWLSFVMLKIFAYIVPWMMFTFIYMFMPNTKVRPKAGLAAGILAGSIYQIIQWTFIKFQIGVSSYNAIYGSFAALPLFLVWMQLSWLTVLFGAEFCNALQNLKRYSPDPLFDGISRYGRKILALEITSLVARNFNEGRPPLDSEAISRSLRMPCAVAEDVLAWLVSSGILCETRCRGSSSYLPSTSCEKFKLSFILRQLDLSGEDKFLESGNPEFRRVDLAVRNLMEEMSRSKSDIRVAEL